MSKMNIHMRYGANTHTQRAIDKQRKFFVFKVFNNITVKNLTQSFNHGKGQEERVLI